MIWRLLVYLAILTLLFGGAGCSSSESSGGNTVVDPPTAAFNETPTSGTAPLLVTFEDKSIGTIDSWDWTFGDGGTSSLQNPLHTYSDVGVFTVTLTVSGPGGSDMATCSNCINVSAAVTNWDEFNWDQENWEG